MTARSVIPRLALVVGVAAAVLLGAAGAASAHPTLLATSPEAGYAVTYPPERVVLVFDEPVWPHSVRVLANGSDEIRTEPVELEQDGRRVVAQLAETLSAGRYVVRWQVTAQDGDVVESAFDFAVGTSTAGLRGGAGEQTTGLPIVTLLRWLLFAGLAVAVGEVVGRRLAHPAAGDPTRSWMRSAAVVGALAAGGLLAHVMVTGGGGRAVPLLALEVAGFTAVVAGAGDRLVVAGLAAVVGAEAWRNHLGSQDGLPGAAVIAVHLAAVAGWVGTLVYLLRTAHARRWSGPEVRRLVAAYARLALILVVLVVGTGTVAARLLVPSWSALVTSGYGRTLLAKLTLVVVAVALAWLARRRDRGGGRLMAVGTAAGGEAGVLAGVLAVTALLVSLPTPAPTTEDLGVPLAATGPVVRLGTLAGNVAVGLAASENQLELRLRVPDDTVQLGEAPPPAYRVSARVSGPGLAPATVPLRGCGPGCFLGPVTWRAGLNRVDLHVDAEGWHGRAALLSVPWPPRVDDRTLAQVVTAMRGQDSVTIVETVTSDTSRPDPPPQTVTISGPKFLDSEPYKEPTGIEAIRLPNIDGRTVIAFGLPAEGVSVVLEVDDRGRVVRETLAAPKHLSKRVFEYGPLDDPRYPTPGGVGS